MRIGIDATVLGPASRYTGVGQYVWNLLQHLAAFQGRHEFIVYGPPNSPRPSGLPDDFCWHALPKRPLGRLAALFTHLYSLPRLAAAHRLDLLHVPTVHARPSQPPVPRRLPCPLVVTLHDLIPLTFYQRHSDGYPWRLRLFFRWNLRAVLGATRVITVSESSRQEILARLPLDEDKVVTIHNGVYQQNPPTTVDHAETPPDAPYILFVGSFEPRKNLRGLLIAYARAVEEGLPQRLVAVAEHDPRRAAVIRDQAQALRLEGQLQIRDSLPETELRTLYRGADVFAFPSLAEGFGLPPLEAMAAGAPVVAADLPALREVLGDAAIFVDPRDEQALAAALLRLARDPQLRARLADDGQRQAARFSWPECGRRTLEVYHAATSLGF